MQQDNIIKVGIGFATGRKNFKNVLKTYIYNWQDSGLVENKKVSLNVFIAYDLTYQQTNTSDYCNVSVGLIDRIDSINYIGRNAMLHEMNYLIQENVLNIDEAHLIFGKGYAAQRNIVLYNAIKQNMDYLIFLDDDEYPMAVTNTRKTAIWGGQQVLSVHLKYIHQADITHGKHCGYVSPIPYIDFNKTFTEEDFRFFIEAISNDIVNWNSLKTIMNNGGVTYANTQILTSDDAKEVKEINHAKFISGANLCINLTDPRRVFPFYNPPGARGEDAFLSTCLSDRKVLRVPCYTFHDGFSTYKHLLEGVLPISLSFIKADSEPIINRFYKACIGWIRYKPLLLYITRPACYEEKIEEIREQLKETLPKLCNYFGRPDFNNILSELEKYHKNVEKHYREFNETKRLWSKLMAHLSH